MFSANLDGKGKDKVGQTGKSYYKLYFSKKDKSGSYSKPEKLSGNIEVISVQDKGSKFTMYIPKQVIETNEEFTDHTTSPTQKTELE